MRIGSVPVFMHIISDMLEAKHGGLPRVMHFAWSPDGRWLNSRCASRLLGSPRTAVQLASSWPFSGLVLSDLRHQHRGVKKESSDWDAYSRSKLFDLMAAQELNRRLHGLRSRAVSLCCQHHERVQS